MSRNNRPFSKLSCERLEDRYNPDAPGPNPNPVPGPVPNATYVVNTERDLPDANIGDGIPLTADGWTSLRSVIDEVNASGNGAGPYVIRFANDASVPLQRADETVIEPVVNQDSMTVYLTSQLPAVAAFRNYIVQGSVDRRVTITRAAGLNPATDRFRFFEVLGGGKLELSGLHLSHANNRGGDGGVVANQFNGTLKVRNCEFVANVSESGGAIANYGALTVEAEGGSKSRFYLNTSGGFGGAIFVGGALATRATIDVRDTLFTENVAGDNIGRIGTQKGGAIASNGDGLLAIERCTFTDNRANEGGAIYADGANLDVEVVVTNSTFQSNVAGDPSTQTPGTGTGKGGAARLLGLKARFAGCNFTNNTSTDQGGAIWQFHGALTLDSCVFSGNLAWDLPRSDDVAETPPPGVATVVTLYNTTAKVVDVR